MAAISRVEGVPEVEAAFKEVGENFEGGAHAAYLAANAILPDVVRNSRAKTGAMAGGWDVDETDTGAEFQNTEFYWPFQEFGTDEVTPSYAIGRAWGKNEDKILSKYKEEMEKAARDAGFSQSTL